MGSARKQFAAQRGNVAHVMRRQLPKVLGLPEKQLGRTEKTTTISSGARRGEPHRECAVPPAQFVLVQAVRRAGKQRNCLWPESNTRSPRSADREFRVLWFSGLGLEGLAG